MAASQENRRALAFMAHPDDAEFLCAGTLIRLAGLGWEIHIASGRPGRLRHDDGEPLGDQQPADRRSPRRGRR